MPERERHGDAIAFLQAEHRAIDEGFSLYFLERSAARWGDILKSTLTTLKIHMELEEEIFYPLYLAATNDDAGYHDSMVEHEVIKNLIADIEHSDPADHLFDAMTRTLWKITSRHIVEEESPDGMFASSAPSLRPELVGRLEMRRAELTEWMTAPRAARGVKPPRSR